ncbi:hypothetical protein OCV51_10210 [Faecalicatena acetigenes]|uniref:Uncharacterized protein n=1 Tax=Faecalicatena acetigenes TaxID=2981790 RepID=A0ABT2TCL0_9FIRM|nr:hypothetical protein [Faecalicatena acetigenes]MCU6748019.1 hypothetical protein [Faecalicatena acetigenes]
MKDYTKFMNWAVVTMIDRSTQDDRKSKIYVSAIFDNPIIAEDVYIKNLPNQDCKRYILPIEDLERFEEFYNHVQDINEEFGDYAIYHINEGFTTDELNKFRQILDLWTDTKIK